MAGRSSRRKGVDFEQEVARAIRSALGVDARRSSGQARKGTDAPDVLGLPAPWWSECKYGVHATMGVVLEGGFRQASREGSKPVLFFRKQRRPLRAVVLADDLLQLMRENADLRAEVERLRGHGG